MFNKVLITSGPTIEPIDPIRYISNRSSGKTGFFLAQEAHKRGINNILFITGKTNYIPSDCEIIKIETALEMYEQVIKYKDQCEVIIMAAAVGDYRCIKYSKEKIKKKGDRTILELKKNPDILQKIGESKGKNQIIVGFAAETKNSLQNAQQKFTKKNLDLLILNEINTTNPVFGSDYNQIYLIKKDGIKKINKTKKSKIAKIIWQEIVDQKKKMI